MMFAEAQAIFRQMRERAAENQEATQEFEQIKTEKTVGTEHHLVEQ